MAEMAESDNEPLRASYGPLKFWVRNLNDRVKLILFFLSEASSSLSKYTGQLFSERQIRRRQRYLKQATYNVQLSQNVRMDNVLQLHFAYKEMLDGLGLAELLLKLATLTEPICGSC